MSISFNHPKNTMTSTGSLNLVVSGGSTTAPQPIRFNSTSVVLPVRALPAGEAGAMVFDTASRTMKYHDGFSWVEILSQATILAPIYTEINQIKQTLNGKVDTVSYISGSVPQASISGTQLNITFPLSSGGGTGGENGLFTSAKQGSIQYYSLTSGMTADTIREQMSGVVDGQSGRNGSETNPWVTNDGWCYSDGMWWTWEGVSGTVTQQVPNYNSGIYFKSMQLDGITQTARLASSATIAGTALTIAQLPAHTVTISGSTDVAGNHTHDTPVKFTYSSNSWIERREGPGGPFVGSGPTTSAGSHIHTFTGTSDVIGSGQAHTHNISNIDVDRNIVAVIYNIATPSYALNENAANEKYVLKSGDIMTGSLTVVNTMTLNGDDANLPFAFRSSDNNERAMIYHSSTTNTLRLRSSSGPEVYIDNTGKLTAPSVDTSTLAVSGIATTGPLNVSGQITATGDIWAFSDKQLKENIKPISNASDILSKITGIFGNMIADPDKIEKSMVIAQEVQEVFPQAVSTDENGYLKVNYIALIPLLIAAFNEKHNGGN